jgi:glycopeptide antibiotics resistance protein
VTLGAPYGTYDVDDVITANAVGQCIVEVQYPTFDNSLGDNDGYNISEQGPIMMIYAQIVVSVIP